jgi:hypothetical protein
VARQKKRSHPAAPLYPQLPSPALNADQNAGALSLSFTQLNDQIANAQVPEAAVTQHEAALAIDGSQVTDAAPTGKYLKDDGTYDTPGSSGLPVGGTDGQVLTKQSAADGDAAWEDVPAGGAHTLDSHSDVDTTGQAADELLVFNGTLWVPRALAATDIPALDAAKITTGTLDAARIPNLDAAKITTGTIDQARLGSGSGGAGLKVLYDDQTYKTASAADGEFMSVRRPFVYFYRSAAAAMASLGCINAALGTGSSPAVADTNELTRTVRIRYTGTTATGQVVGIRSNEALFMAKTGFRYRAVFGTESDINDSRAFIGINSSTTIISTGDPSAGTDLIGVGYDQADLNSGNWYLMHNDNAGTATRVDTGVARTATTLLRLEIDTEDGTSYDVKLYDLEAGTLTYSGTITLNIPTVTTALRINAQIRNEVTAGGTAPLLAIAHMYCEHGARSI